MATGVRKSAVETLGPSETLFVQLLADVDAGLTIAECGEQAGYTRQYAYQKRHSERIVRALDKLLDERERERKRETGAVLSSLAQRAIHGDNFAAKVYLEGMGRGGSGVKVVTHVNTQQTVDPIEERIKRIAELVPEKS